MRWWRSPTSACWSGCFGNAIPLTAYQSFLKDVVLLIFVVPIVLSAFLGRIQLNTPRQGTAVYAAAMVVTYLFGEMMLDWNFPVLYLALNLIAAEAVKRRWNHPQKEWGMALAVVVVSGFVQFWTLGHLPLKDYRPYAVGENVENRMTAEELGLRAQCLTRKSVSSIPRPGRDACHAIGVHGPKAVGQGQRARHFLHGNLPRRRLGARP